MLLFDSIRLECVATMVFGAVANDDDTGDANEIDLLYFQDYVMSSKKNNSKL